MGLCNFVRRASSNGKTSIRSLGWLRAKCTHFITEHDSQVTLVFGVRDDVFAYVFLLNTAISQDELGRVY